MEENIALLEFENNPNIGLFMFVNDSFVLLGEQISDDKKKQIESVLDVPVYSVTALGTSLLGIFITGNNSTIVIPELYDYETKIIQEIAKKHSVEVVEIHHRLNTYGNSICMSDSFTIISPNYSKQFKSSLEKKTKLSCYFLNSSELGSAGALCRYFKNTLFVSQELNENIFDKAIVKSITGTGTVNSGSIFVSSGVIGNSNGIILGSHCSSVEIQALVEAFDFLE